MTLSGKVYFVVNEGSLVYASTDKDDAECYMENKNYDAAVDEAEESGRDVDDLTPEELAEYAFASGYNGGYHYMDTIKIPKHYDGEEEFETCEGDTFTYYELESLLE